VQTVADAFGELEAQIESVGRPETAIAKVIRDARRALVEQGFTPAASVVDRALRVVLIETLQGEAGSLADLNAAQAADAWRANRGPHAAHLVQRVLGEVLGQYARHVATRDVHRLVGGDAAPTVAHARRLARDLAERVSAVAERVDVASVEPSRVAAAWPNLVAAAFAEGKRPPRVDA
jgi:hypothetical protein